MEINTLRPTPILNPKTFLKKKRKVPSFPSPPLSREGNSLKTATCVNRTRVIHVKTPAIVQSYLRRDPPDTRGGEGAVEGREVLASV